jgi:DnaJ-class molecular chaperone
MDREEQKKQVAEYLFKRDKKLNHNWYRGIIWKNAFKETKDFYLDEASQIDKIYHPEAKPCPDCKGKSWKVDTEGEIIFPAKVCPACKGSGEVQFFGHYPVGKEYPSGETTGYKTCPECKGRGYHEGAVDPVTITRHDDLKYPCSTCHGTGKQPAERK